MSKFNPWLLLLLIPVCLIIIYLQSGNKLGLLENGKKWTSYQTLAQVNGDALIISGTGGNTKGSMIMMLPASIQPGEYPLPDTKDILISYISADSQYHVPAQGSLIIQEANQEKKRMAGTFEYHSQLPHVAITKGYFKVHW